MSQQKKSTDSDIEWENRVLCSDGNCIGVIGPDGRCKECGLQSDQDIGDGVIETREYADDDVDDDIETPSDADEEGEITDAEWEDRVLCSDESCIGTIGPDGTCNECDKPPA